MQVVQCPATLQYGLKDPNLLFLGGGISGCPDWQKEMIQRFEGDDIILINPRRDDFDITDPEASKFQIHWEHGHLTECVDKTGFQGKAILFWFPFETLCPITLFELGKYAALGAKIFVGCHPAYARVFDVKEQLRLMRPDVTVHSNFKDLVADVRQWFGFTTPE